MSSLATRGNTIIAGTSSGSIYRFNPDNNTWNLTKIGTKQSGISDLIAFNNAFFAATNGGILQSTDNGFSWHMVNASTTVTGFVVFREALLAITPSALLRNDPETASWTSIQTMYGSGSSSTAHFSQASPIRFVAAMEGKVYLATTRRILASEDLNSWHESDLGLGLTDRRNDSHAVSLTRLVATQSKLFAITASANNPPHLYVSNSREGAWHSVSVGFGNAFAAPDHLFLLTFDRIQYEQSESYELPVPGTSVHDLIKVGNSVVIATDRGVYTKSGDSASWNKANTGLLTGFAGTLATDGRNLVTIRDDKVFKSIDQGKTWDLLLFDSTRTVSRSRMTFQDAVVVEDLVFVATNQGLYSGKVSDDVVSEVAFTSKMGKGSARLPNVEQIEVSDNGVLYAAIRDPDKDMETNVFRSTNLGQTWEPTIGLPDLNFAPIHFQETLKAAGRSVFVSYSELETVDVFRLRPGANSWDRVSDGLRQSEVTAFTSAGNATYAAASRPASTGVKFSPLFLKLEPTETASRWEVIEGIGLTGQVNALWSDPEHPEVVIAVTDDGLFWSSDAGEHFNQGPSTEREATLPRVSAISEFDGKLFINADSGIFYVHDEIRRGKWYTPWIGLIRQYKPSIIAVGFIGLILVVLSTRLISLFLQLDLWGLKQAAPLFYLTPPGRMKLYRRYRASLRHDADVKYSIDHYVDLPYEADVELASMGLEIDREKPVPLSDLFIQLNPSSRVVVIADGGNGKSTLCSYVAHRCVTKRDVFGKKRLEPVVIDGLTYNGDFLNTITNLLKEKHAYVNKTIVSSQLTAGNLLIIFDGFTEIRETYWPAAFSADLPEFIRQHPDTPFMFTSRSPVPASVRRALGNVISIRLTTVDDPQELVTFFGNYLKRGMQEADSLIKEIDLKFKALPRIPLLLKLVATVYDKKGKVPKDTAALFAEYAQYVLRPEATGIDEPIGLNYALRHLVRESYLRSGGDRGLTIDQGVELLVQIENKLAAYDIRIAPIRLLRVLTQAGLYKEVGMNLRFFHDSFESYFAALALEADFRERKHDSIRQCARNERLFETWQFLNEILEESGEKPKLHQLQQEAETNSS